MDKHSETSLRKILGELQPDEPVAGSVGVPELRAKHQTCRKRARGQAFRRRVWTPRGAVVFLGGFRSPDSANPGVCCVSLQWAFFDGLLHN